MIAFSTALAAALLIQQSSALPTVKRVPDVSGNTIADLLSATYRDFLAIQGGNITRFYALNGWKTMDIVAPSASLDAYMANNFVLSTADRLANLTAKGGDGAAITFSSQYEGFIQQVNSALGVDNLNKDPQLKNLTAQAGKACGDDLANAAIAALKPYIKLHGGNSSLTTTDPAFVKWANANYPPYLGARQDCQVALNAYDKKVTDLYGTDFSVYAAALNNIQALIGAGGQENVPGITMPITETGIDAKVGALVPLYSFPSLNGTISAWRSGAGAPTYSKTADSELIAKQTDGSTDSIHAGMTSILGLGGDASASSTDNSSLSTTGVSSMTVSFKGIQLMGVERGAWFDNWRSASALHNDASTDPKHQAAKKVFDHYLGTPSQPGSAALYNDKALIAYQPFVNITFANQAQYDAAHSDSAKFDTSGLFGIVTTGGETGSNSGKSQFNNDTLSVVYQDTSPTAYLIGYVVASFWESP